ncbi:hypothetical protein SRHO_G00334550 [Serrasalmus rhombeus]
MCVFGEESSSSTTLYRGFNRHPTARRSSTRIWGLRSRVARQGGRRWGGGVSKPDQTDRIYDTTSAFPNPRLDCASHRRAVTVDIF